MEEEGRVWSCKVVRGRERRVKRRRETVLVRVMRVNVRGEARRGTRVSTRSRAS